MADDRMQEAEAQLFQRIHELRERALAAAAGGEETASAAPAEGAAPGAAAPDLRALLARTEGHVDELRSTAAGLEQSLPARLERVVERALDDHSQTRRLAELREAIRGLSGQVEQLNRDLLAERLGRIEDLELMLDLFSTGIGSLRGDVAGVAAAVERVTGGLEDVGAKLDQPLQVTVERPRTAGVTDLFRRTGDNP